MEIEMNVESIVLDTSVFTNPDVYSQFGDDPVEALRSFCHLALKAPMRFYMPLSVYQELGTMVDLTAISEDLEMALKIRSPQRFKLMIPAELLYEFIDELRRRIDKGLRIAEQAITTKEVADEELVRRVRQKYREALRRGLIDSKEDMDVILLAFELKAILTSADEGIMTWADKLGIEIMNVRNLRSTIEGLVKQRGSLE